MCVWHFIPLSHGTEWRSHSLSLTVLEKHRQFGTNKNKSIRHKKRIRKREKERKKCLLDYRW